MYLYLFILNFVLFFITSTIVLSSNTLLKLFICLEVIWLTLMTLLVVFAVVTSTVMNVYIGSVLIVISTIELVICLSVYFFFYWK